MASSRDFGGSQSVPPPPWYDDEVAGVKAVILPKNIIMEYGVGKVRPRNLLPRRTKARMN